MTKNTRKIFIILLLFNFAILFAGEYHVDHDKENLVKFISNAPIEDFEGITDQIDGYLYWDGDDFTDQSEFFFEVDLNSLDTGIGLRNRHMRENYLHTDKYPTTHYSGKIIKYEKLSDMEYSVWTEGEIFIHGIKKNLNIYGRFTSESDTIYHMQVEFEVKLSDFQIEIPSLMFMKIDERMQLVLDFYIKKFNEE